VKNTEVWIGNGRQPAVL